MYRPLFTVPVGCVWGGGLSGQRPPGQIAPYTQTPLDRDPSGQRPPGQRPPWTETLPWTASDPPLWTDKMLLKTLPCSKLRLRAIITIGVYETFNALYLHSTKNPDVKFAWQVLA